MIASKIPAPIRKYDKVLYSEKVRVRIPNIKRKLPMVPIGPKGNKVSFHVILY